MSSIYDLSPEQLNRLQARSQDLRALDDTKLVMMLLLLGMQKDLAPGEALDLIACRIEAQRRLFPRT